MRAAVGEEAARHRLRDVPGAPSTLITDPFKMIDALSLRKGAAAWMVKKPT